MTKTEKCRAGEFRVFHVGKMAYTVEFHGDVLRQFTNLSTAFAFASNRYFASKSEAA